MRTAYLLTFLFSLSLHAGFDIGRDTFRATELEQAKAKAAAENRLITVVYSDAKTNCGLCSYASSAAIDDLGKDTILVYAERKTWTRLPIQVQRALNAPEAGRYIPKTVIFDATLEKKMATVPYARGKEYHKNLKAARRYLGAAIAPRIKTIGSTSTSRSTAQKSQGSRTWTDTQGRTVTGSIYSKSGDSIRLRTTDGKIITVRRDKLSQADQDYLKSK